MSVNYTPKTYTAGSPLLAAELNTEVRDLSSGLQGAWNTYTPSLSGWTLGNGTLSGRVRREGKTLDIQVNLLVGSTTAASGAPIFSLPAAAFLAATGPSAVGNAWLFDASSGASNYQAPVFSSSGITARAWDGTPTSPTSPWTWATGDRIILNARYEAA